MPFLAFDWSGWVVPASLRLVAPLGSSGSTTYSGRSFLYVSLNQLTSLRQTTLTMLDLEPWIVLIGHSGNWKLDQRCPWWHNSVTNSDICACVCVKVATQHDSCNNNQRKLGSKPAVILQSWLSFFDCSAAFSFHLVCLKSHQLHLCKLIPALQKWDGASISLLMLQHAFQVTGQIPEVHEIHQRWTPVWPIAEEHSLISWTLMPYTIQHRWKLCLRLDGDFIIKDAISPNGNRHQFVGDFGEIFQRWVSHWQDVIGECRWERACFLPQTTHYCQTVFQYQLHVYYISWG